jgi:hypothetical protein
VPVRPDDYNTCITTIIKKKNLKNTIQIHAKKKKRFNNDSFFNLPNLLKSAEGRVTIIASLCSRKRLAPRPPTFVPSPLEAPARGAAPP